MSNFCGVISECGERMQDTQLQFVHLDIIARCLLHETEELGTDFDTKALFTNEQNRKLLRNEKGLVGVDACVQELFTQMAMLEEEMKENDQHIMELEKNVQNLECVAELFSSTQQFANQQSSCSEHESMLQMLERTHRVMLYLNGLMDKVYECDQIAMDAAETNPYSIITAILDMHVRTLQKTDKNLDTLLNKTLAVDKAFQEVMAKISTIQMPAGRLNQTPNCYLASTD